MSQAPQLALSVRVSTSQPLAGLPSQSAKPVAHAPTVHAPTRQIAIALGSAQARPHAPQWAGLTVSSASQPLVARPSQSPKPAAQRDGVHIPPAQPCPATLASAQTVPHAPQLVGSMAALAQNAVPAVPQVASGAAQVAPHTPAEHTWPAAQPTPQAPQWALLVRVSTSQPLLATWSQSAKPASQVATAHAPAAHADVAWASRHARPQPPQCAALDVVSSSQPLVAAPSQSPKPTAQRTMAHSPPVHPCTWVLASTHARPHRPQSAGSMAVFAQNRAGAVPQVVAGAAQVAPQTPPEHTRPAVQALPQAPQ